MKTIPAILSAQRDFFKTEKTKDIPYRLSILKALKEEIISNEQAFYDTLKKDFKKSEFEAFLSEYGLVISELNLAIKNLKKWARPERIKSSLLTFPSQDYIYKDPYGCVLIIAPWNYPFLLAIGPLIMAIAAGNTVVLKPSELTMNTSKLLVRLIEKVFPPEFAVVVEGGIETSTELLAQKWDYIFFTGSVTVGKVVAKAAAKHLTPMTLELGGKSPCIIDKTVNLELVASRVVWGKFFNGGQTCIAADYVIIHSDIKDAFITALKTKIVTSYGTNPYKSPDFPRIINNKNFLRFKDILKDVDVVFGGKLNEKACYLSPTLVDKPPLDSDLMKDEIFGPILPILTYNSEKDIEDIIYSFDKPLSLYIFSKSTQFIENTLKKFSFGNGAVNDLLVQFGNHRLPFGGVGASGMGAYHGKTGFDNFSHSKSIVKRGTWFDPSFRYPPYKGKLSLLKKVFKYFG